MTAAWIDPDRKIVSRYLGQLRLSSHARSVYAQVLRDFQAVAERRRAVDRKTLEAWLREWERIGNHLPCFIEPAS